MLANVRRLELTGQHSETVITGLLRSREVGSARDVLAILHHGLATHLETANLPVPKIAGIIEQSVYVDDPEMRTAINDREHAIQVRAEYLVEQAITLSPV